ncbi:hypothetical protein Tsubulata_002689 [Turnera subulata]|uniref:Uncharacterized protein n=1 Tax=Turnera subulata TaxID=218843 RepID=A0A9Q0F5Y7_9ROSI|nr:hypothetical protein Tsubulata_002689 [Turnera subulata]
MCQESSLTLTAPSPSPSPAGLTITARRRCHLHHLNQSQPFWNPRSGMNGSGKQGRREEQGWGD